ncbi:hypothetical protein CDEST_09787 [Colletotrichum destructivum]|uniref:C2H2-type domain-containing protein n=1 Tax=Colletotrichum destructivum TaxID=34406 RepID=A0AAX4IQ06_9PEZI|nr:hypothetical protein CDEST_09787 [Colletotrichum destructivum]
MEMLLPYLSILHPRCLLGLSLPIRQSFEPLSVEPVQGIASPQSTNSVSDPFDSDDEILTRREFIFDPRNSVNLQSAFLRTPRSLAFLFPEISFPSLPTPASHTLGKRKLATVEHEDQGDEANEDDGDSLLSKSPNQSQGHPVTASSTAAKMRKGPRERRWESLLPTLKLQTRYPASKSLALEDPFDFVYSLPAIPGQDCTSDVVKHHSKLLSDMASWELRALKFGESTPKIFLRVSTKDFKQREALSLCAKLIDAKKVSWNPAELEAPRVRKPSSLITSLAKAAQYSLFPDKPFRIANPALTQTAGAWSWIVALPCVDAETYALKTFKWRIAVKKLDSSTKVCSRDMGCTEPIGDAAINTWLTTNSILEVWGAMARGADAANAQMTLGHEPPNACHCVDEAKSKTAYACGHCGKETMCEFGYRACPACCGIVIETRTSNRAKLHFPERLHSHTRTLVEEIDVPLKYANENLYLGLMSG